VFRKALLIYFVSYDHMEYMTLVSSLLSFWTNQIILFRYDPVLDTWTKMAPMLQHRSGASAAVLDGFLYVIGGTDGDIALNSGQK